MTLSRFFIKYVYIPLGGSRKGKLRTVINVLIVFVLSGLWHGAGWTYVCWGLMQGLLVVWDNLGITGVTEPEKANKKTRYLLREKPLFVVPRAVGNAVTFTMFVISLIFFGSQNLEYVGAMFRRLFVWTYPGFLYKTAENLAIPENYIFRQLFTQMGKPEMVNIVYVATFVLLIVRVEFYSNSKRIHQSLGYLTPNQFEKVSA